MSVFIHPIQLGLSFYIQLFFLGHKNGLPPFSRKRIATTQTQNKTRLTNLVHDQNVICLYIIYNVYKVVALLYFY